MHCTASKTAAVSSFFGADVFTVHQMQEMLPKGMWSKVQAQMAGSRLLDREAADAVAHAAKTWAMQKGATHFTHWFQPLTNGTAEKHDAFLSLGYGVSETGLQTSPMERFSGAQLMQAEPDASSFPNGGVRSTFEARGYTVWDTSAPMFLYGEDSLRPVLYIPSVFISYTGDALDERTVLLRSGQALSEAVLELLRHVDPGNLTKRIFPTLGTEQEFFLVNRDVFQGRPDLGMCGRTLIGSLPPRHQQLEDHYFGAMPGPVLRAIEAAEMRLARLGVPLKTRHNEVAPGQFEVAPIFEEAPTAVDHNLLTMQVLKESALKEGLVALFHEKPFAGVNGSGKHCNWSLCTDQGTNLLDPGETPESNTVFLCLLAGILQGLKKHGSLLRASIASAANDHRLGANEAPPSIISAFLGEHLTEVVDSIVKAEARVVTPDSVTAEFSQVSISSPHKSKRKDSLTSVWVGRKTLDVRVATLPEISRDTTDRNRTSPFAFTGNKFEFRAVGSSQSPAFPVAMLNAIVAAGVREFTSSLKTLAKQSSITASIIQAALQASFQETSIIRFEGDGYSAAWVQEAERRGLPNLRNAPAAFNALSQDSNRNLLIQELHVLTERELASRHHVLLEKYTKEVQIEAGVMISLVKQQILPAAISYRKQLTDAALAAKSLGQGYEVESNLSASLGKILSEVSLALESLQSVSSSLSHDKDASILVPLMHSLRKQVDTLETLLPVSSYPLPSYSQLLFLKH